MDATELNALELLNSLNADDIEQQLADLKKKVEDETEAEKDRHQKALAEIKEKYQGKIDGLKQMQRIVNARDNKPTKKEPAKRTSWAPQVQALLKRVNRPLTSGEIIKGVNGGGTIYSVLTRYSDLFYKIAEGKHKGKWWLVDGKDKELSPAEQVIGMPGEKLAELLERTGPLTVALIQDHTGKDQDHLIRVLRKRTDLFEQQERSGMWQVRGWKG